MNNKTIIKDDKQFISHDIDTGKDDVMSLPISNETILEAIILLSEKVDKMLPKT